MKEPHYQLNRSARLQFKIWVLLNCVLLLVSCGNNNTGEPTIHPIHEPGLQEKQNISVAGLEREYLIYLPTDPATAKIVLMLHGNSGSSSQLLGLNGKTAPFKTWMDIALLENLILLVPDGLIGPNGKQGWNDCRNDAPTNPAVDDVAFINALLDEVQVSYGNNADKVYSIGISNGGLMTLRLADEMPDRLRAIAIVVASKPVNSECVDSAVPLPVLFMNGTDDPILPYSGGQIGSDRGIVLSTVDTVNFWVNRNQTYAGPVQPIITDIDQSENSSVLHYSYVNGTDGATVEHYEIVNGGHTEPSIQERYGRIYKLVVGEQNGDIEMADKIWTFFSAN
ncbi:MAG: hypothetical protein V3U65_16635 [Granulosicoccaceae bacterium]